MNGASARRRARTAARLAASPVATVRAGWWAWSSARSLARALANQGVDAVSALTPAPAVAPRHRQTVAIVLGRSGATCLVRSAVLQRWDADHGQPRPLVIGVDLDEERGFSAHAWLEGERHERRFVELHRRPPPAPSGG